MVQLVECFLAKEEVVGANPITRSTYIIMWYIKPVFNNGLMAVVVAKGWLGSRFDGSSILVINRLLNLNNGLMAEWLGSGLQNRSRRFNSGSRLQKGFD